MVSLTAVLAGGLTMATTGPAQAVGPAQAAGWQCSVPPGMTWDWVTWDPDCGVPNGISYNVIAPGEGVWACMVPVGWNWTATQVSTRCSTNIGFPTTEYRLTRA
jgi:hypothetical protein